MLASIFGRRKSAARRSAIRIPAAAAEVEPDEQQEQREAAKRKRKRSSAAAPAPTPAPAPRRSATSGAARRRQAKEAAATTNGVEVATAATAATVSTSPAIPAVLAVAVFGDTTLEPWTTFELLKGGGKFPQILTSYMAKFKAFKEPTAIQAHCWPYACAGRHVIGISKTGSGKTLAFLLPALRKVLSFKHAATPSFGPYALVLTPTRELAIQIARDATGLCKATRIRMACLYGGTSKAQQIKSLDFGVDLLICTPGRLHDLVNKPDKYTGQAAQRNSGLVDFHSL